MRKRLPVILLLVIGGAIALLNLYKDQLAARALRQVAGVAGKAGHRVDFGAVHVSLLSGTIRLTDLRVAPLADSTREDSAVHYTVRAETIDLRGVDLPALFRRKVLHVGAIALHAPTVEHSFITRAKTPSGHGATDTVARTTTPLPLDLLRVDTLEITNATGHSQDRTSTHPALAVGDMDLLITGIQLRQDEQGRPVPEVAGIRLDLAAATMQIQPFYTLVIDSIRIRVPQDSAAIFGTRFSPTVSPTAYHRHVDHQVELYSIAVDTLLLTGFDLAARLQSGTVGAHQLYLAGVAVDIHRDKSLPPAPLKPKPLAADRITNWKLPLQVDTVRVRNARITYHERLARDADYGSIAFTHIDGLLTGLGNLPQDHPPDLHLVGAARVGHARAQLDLRMPMHADHSTVSTRVQLFGFPATDMNRMTGDLLHLNATRGTIHRVDLRMQGDEHRATATMDMHYEDLLVELGEQIKHAKLLSRVANVVVRGSNMPAQNSYRNATYSFARPVDAGAFKYIWVGLRTGLLEVMLPPAALKHLHRQQQKAQER